MSLNRSIGSSATGEIIIIQDLTVSGNMMFAIGKVAYKLSWLVGRRRWRDNTRTEYLTVADFETWRLPSSVSNFFLVSDIF
jgi:hypothetical protein